MKRTLYFIVSFLFMVNTLYGQGELEASQFSRTDLTGTARAISMGGAFGALGGDLTGVSINPAGIGVYRSSEVVATAVFQNYKFKAGDITSTKNNFNFHNIGFIGYFPTRNEAIPVINFGFSYNKAKSFDRDIRVATTGRSSSLTDYMAFIATSANLPPDNMNYHSDPWIAVLGYDAHLINPKPAENSSNRNEYQSILNEKEAVQHSLGLSEKGAIDVFDFTVGTSINNILNVGLSLSVTGIYYDLYSRNSEDFALRGNFDLHNWLETRGNGIGVKLGVIYRPIHELRLGFSYHSPTWYSLNDTYNAQINSSFNDGKKYKITPDKDARSYVDDYDFKSPDKWTASIATILGNSMIISMDYELTNYKSMKYSTPSGTSGYNPAAYDHTNSLIKADYKATSTVRAGLEYRFTPQFYGRLGYAWMQYPYNKTLVDLGDAQTTDSRTEYRIEGDASYFTGGLGYRFNRHFFADLAFVYKTQKDDLYAYPNVYDYDKGNILIDAIPYKLDNNTFKAQVTVGYKF